MAKKPTSAPQPETTQVLGENTTLTLKIAWSDLKKEYDHALAKSKQRVAIPGFRKGKVPQHMAEAAVGVEKLLEHALEHLVPGVYEKEVEKAGIVPLVAPHFSVKSGEMGKDWELLAETAVAPEIELGKYETAIKEAAKKYKTATPKSDEPAPEKEATPEDAAKRKEDELLQHIFLGLIDHVHPKIAPLLVQDEMRRQINDLFSQLSQYHITPEQYLERSKKTQEEFNTEMAAVALGSLQLEFILRAIAKERKIEVSDKDLLEVLGEKATKESLEKLPAQLKAQFVSTLQRKKTTQELLQLAA